MKLDITDIVGMPWNEKLKKPFLSRMELFS